MPRAYEPIWKQLKRDGLVIVTAAPSRHRRIIKAVSKEKWMDVAFRDTGATKIISIVEGDKITFNLRDFRHINIILAEQRGFHFDVD